MNSVEQETNPEISEAHQEVRDGRECIDAIDVNIMQLIAERLKVARVIGRAKRVIGVPVFSAGREMQVMQRAADMAAELGMEPEIGSQVMGPIVAASRRAQSLPLNLETTHLEVDAQ